MVVQTFNLAERYCLIWFYVGTPQQRRSHELETIQSILHDIFVLQNLKAVEAKLQQFYDRKIFFIFDGEVDNQVLLRIHRRFQVVAIYMLYPDRRSQLDESKRILPKVIPNKRK